MPSPATAVTGAREPERAGQWHVHTRALASDQVPRANKAPIERGDSGAHVSIARSTRCRDQMVEHRMRATYSRRLLRALTQKDKIDVRIVAQGE